MMTRCQILFVFVTLPCAKLLVLMFAHFFSSFFNYAPHTRTPQFMKYLSVPRPVVGVNATKEFSPFFSSHMLQLPPPLINSLSSSISGKCLVTLKKT